jgi:hypothetical protein
VEGRRMSIENYKITFAFMSDDEKKYEVICSCGYVGEVGRDPIYAFRKCPECENTNTRTLWRKVKSAVAGSEIEVLDKHDKGFHARINKYVAYFNNDRTGFRLKLSSAKEAKFDLRHKIIEFNKIDGDHVTKISEDTFFRDINETEFLQAVSTERSYTLYKLAKRYLGRKGYEVADKLGRALKRLLNYPCVELFYSIGFRDLSFTFDYNLNTNGFTKPHEILGVPQYTLKYLKDMKYINIYQLKKLKKLDQAINGNNVKIVLQILSEEASVDDIWYLTDPFIELYQTYGYKDVKRLILYLAREVKLQQGITSPDEAATLLRDYVRMCQQMEMEYEKYPKSLKKEHDIAAMNYMIRSDEIKKKKFANVVDKEDYKRLEYKQKNYSILIPKEPDDLIAEGTSLSHCVASYVDDVISEKCKIVFLRKTGYEDESLVTIEVRDNNIRQVRGRYNRKPFPQEMEFVRKWAEAKGLVVATYY